MNPPKTLAEAIEDVVAIESGGPPYEGLGPAITVLARARGRLDGLEESRALIDARSHAYEHATHLTHDAGAGKWTATHERILEVAQFLAPAWVELEDPLGPTATAEELEASEATAVAHADEVDDLLARARIEIEELQADKEQALSLIRGYVGQISVLEADVAALRKGPESNEVRDLITFEGRPYAMRAELAREWRRMRDQLAKFAVSSES